jgi:hypothetical protein
MESGVDGPKRRKRRPPAPAGADRARGAAGTGAGAGRGPDRGAADAPAPGERAALPAPEPSRTELRNQEARLALAPLAPGERPRPLLAAIAVAGLLGAGNLIAYTAGAKIAGHHPGAGVLAFTAVMALLAGGMWARRYLAVLAFEALLAVTVIFFSLFLVEASNLEGVLLCVGVIAGGGWLFWKLVRVMGRLSAPRQSSS